jgi:hypothetical protein
VQKLLVKVINLEYGFLESRKRVSRINLKASRISLGCVGEGVCGMWRWGGEWGVGGMIIGDAMIMFSNSSFEIPVFEIPVFEINI